MSSVSSVSPAAILGTFSLPGRQSPVPALPSASSRPQPSLAQAPGNFPSQSLPRKPLRVGRGHSSCLLAAGILSPHRRHRASKRAASSPRASPRSPGPDTRPVPRSHQCGHTVSQNRTGPGRGTRSGGGPLRASPDAASLPGWEDPHVRTHREGGPPEGHVVSEALLAGAEACWEGGVWPTARSSRAVRIQGSFTWGLNTEPSRCWSRSCPTQGSPAGSLGPGLCTGLPPGCAVSDAALQRLRLSSCFPVSL